MEFFNNKNNDTLKFKINSEGVNVSSLDARLVFRTNESKNYMVAGIIENDVCLFDVPQLSEYKKETKGSVIFEIVSGDTYFKVWEDAFSVDSKATIVLEDVQEVKREKKPEIHVKSIIAEPIIEKKIEKKKEKTVKRKKEKTEGFPTFDQIVEGD